MFRVKICGITKSDDALLAVRHGADAIGINFWEGSSRYVSTRQATVIADAARSQAVIVGVFVDAQAAAIRDVVDAVGLDMVQLHGDELPETTNAVNRPVCKAFRLGRTHVDQIVRYVQTAAQHSKNLQGILLDAFVPESPGGSGRLADWAAASELVRRRPILPVILAGGLNPENVAAAIRRVRPHGVDVASGVEHLPGEKCSERIADFVRAAHDALAQNRQRETLN